MPKVPAALGAGDFCADHEEGAVAVLLNCSLLGGQEEGRPAAAGLELVVAQEQRRPAASALELARLLNLIVFRAPWPLGSFSTQDLRIRTPTIYIFSSGLACLNVVYPSVFFIIIFFYIRRKSS